jgi:hypothetical protein
MKNLRRRIERLEAATGSSFQTKLRLLSARMIASDILLEIYRHPDRSA